MKYGILILNAISRCWERIETSSPDVQKAYQQYKLESQARYQAARREQLMENECSRQETKKMLLFSYPE